MSASTKPIGIRKKRTTNFGRNTVRVQVGKYLEGFTVHEDLLCLNSPWFRMKIQPKRKALDQEVNPECSICREPLEPGVKELTHCAAMCGTSFHYNCIERWQDTKAGKGSSKCPMCRQNWTAGSTKNKVYFFSGLDEVGYSIYQEWLYRRHICIENHDDEDEKPHLHSLIQAYLFGAQILDNHFCAAVLEASLDIFTEADLFPSPKCLRTAYENTFIGSPLRRFLVHVYMKRAVDSWYEKEKADKYPVEFLLDLIKAQMNATGPRPQWNLEEAKKELCKDKDEDHVGGVHHVEESESESDDESDLADYQW